MYNNEGLVWIRDQMGPIGGLNICEFGNQHIWVHTMTQFDIPFSVARDWYYSMGVTKYISIDLNGEDGAIEADLTEPLTEVMAEKFDIVTNIGCTEHMGNDPHKQWTAFCNAVKLAKTGGIILHNLPPEGQWVDHCDIWYKDGLGQVLADAMACELLVEERINLASLNPHADYLCIALRKQDDLILPEYPPDVFTEKLAV